MNQHVVFLFFKKKNKNLSFRHLNLIKSSYRDVKILWWYWVQDWEIELPNALRVRYEEEGDSISAEIAFHTFNEWVASEGPPLESIKDFSTPGPPSFVLRERDVWSCGFKQNGTPHFPLDQL